MKTQEINPKLEEKIQFSGISEASESWQSAKKEPGSNASFKNC